jgi:hypothetical protein
MESSLKSERKMAGIGKTGRLRRPPVNLVNRQEVSVGHAKPRFFRIHSTSFAQFCPLSGRKSPALDGSGQALTTGTVLTFLSAQSSALDLRKLKWFEHVPRADRRKRELIADWVSGARMSNLLWKTPTAAPNVESERSFGYVLPLSPAVACL